MSEHKSKPTLIKPPPILEHCSPIENTLALLPLDDIGPDIFTNARPLWHPAGARGIFGGAAIAQCLSAAQFTIPSDEFTVHSMHCYFVLAGNSEIPVLYHVERVRDGRSFITRTVQACQRGKCIFTTTISFTRAGSGGRMTINHARQMPSDVPPPPPDGDQTAKFDENEQPFEAVRCPTRLAERTRTQTPRPEDKLLRQWIRARGRISDYPPSTRAQEVLPRQRAGVKGENHESHLAALAYMSDRYFIGTVSRVHNLIRFSQLQNIDQVVRSFRGSEQEKADMRTYLEKIAAEVEQENDDVKSEEDDGKRIGMTVSLDHSIYFHNPRDFRADEWMLTETETPWAGDGRGLVFQRIWSKSGVLIATCIQEGVVRLVQEKTKL